MKIPNKLNVFVSCVLILGLSACGGGGGGSSPDNPPTNTSASSIAQLSSSSTTTLSSISSSSLSSAASSSASSAPIVTIDVTPPTVILTGASSVQLKQGDTYSEQGATASDLTDGVVTVVTTGTVDTSKVGSYTITYTATDKAGNSANVKRTVTVTDSIAPTVTLTGASTVSVKQDAIYTELGATASDLTDGVLAIVTTGTVDTSKVGSYTITYTATDKAGNSANLKRTVAVTDSMAPVVTLLGSATISLYVGDIYTEAGATALDAVDGVLTSSIVTTGQVNTATAGIYNFTYSATDAAGNMGTKSRSVTVKSPDYNFSVLDKDLRLWESEYEHTFQLMFHVAETKERTINVSIASTSTASAGTDVDIVSGTIVVPANSKIGNLKLAIHDDGVLERTQTIIVKFAAGSFKKEITIELNDETISGETQAGLSHAISNPQVTVNGNDLVIMGSNSYENYSLISQSSTVVSSFYPGITSGSAISFEGNNYMCAGGKLYQLSLQTGYSLLTESPWYSNSSTTGILNGELYVIGGATTFENASTQVLIYNFGSGIWRQGAVLSTKRDAFYTTAAVANGKYMCLGATPILQTPLKFLILLPTNGVFLQSSGVLLTPLTPFM